MVRCAGGTCNCGVLVRSGDDVIRIDKCKWVNKTSAAYPINDELFTVGDLTPRTQIFQEKDGKQFQVRKTRINYSPYLLMMLDSLIAGFVISLKFESCPVFDVI